MPSYGYEFWQKFSDFGEITKNFEKLMWLVKSASNFTPDSVQTQGRRELQKSGWSECPICPQFSENSLFIAFLCDPSDPPFTSKCKWQFLRLYLCMIRILIMHANFYFTGNMSDIKNDIVNQAFTSKIVHAA